jgi:hypothetical protein
MGSGHSLELFRAHALHRALGLDRRGSIFARRRASERSDLLVAILAARDDNIFGVDILAETRKFVRSHLVAASYHRPPAFDLRRTLASGTILPLASLTKPK